MLERSLSFFFLEKGYHRNKGGLISEKAEQPIYGQPKANHMINTLLKITFINVTKEMH